MRKNAQYDDEPRVQQVQKVQKVQGPVGRDNSDDQLGAQDKLETAKRTQNANEKALDGVVSAGNVDTDRPSRGHLLESFVVHSLHSSLNEWRGFVCEQLGNTRLIDSRELRMSESDDTESGTLYPFGSIHIDCHMAGLHELACLVERAFFKEDAKAIIRCLAQKNRDVDVEMFLDWLDPVAETTSRFVLGQSTAWLPDNVTVPREIVIVGRQKSLEAVFHIYHFFHVNILVELCADGLCIKTSVPSSHFTNLLERLGVSQDVFLCESELPPLDLSDKQLVVLSSNTDFQIGAISQLVRWGASATTTTHCSKCDKFIVIVDETFKADVNLTRQPSAPSAPSTDSTRKDTLAKFSKLHVSKLHVSKLHVSKANGMSKRRRRSEKSRGRGTVHAHDLLHQLHKPYYTHQSTHQSTHQTQQTHQTNTNSNIPWRQFNRDDAQCGQSSQSSPTSFQASKQHERDLRDPRDPRVIQVTNANTVTPVIPKRQMTSDLMGFVRICCVPSLEPVVFEQSIRNALEFTPRLTIHCVNVQLPNNITLQRRGVVSETLIEQLRCEHETTLQNDTVVECEQFPTDPTHLVFFAAELLPQYKKWRKKFYLDNNYLPHSVSVSKRKETHKSVSLHLVQPIEAVSVDAILKVARRTPFKQTSLADLDTLL